MMALRIEDDATDSVVRQQFVQWLASWPTEVGDPLLDDFGRLIKAAVEEVGLTFDELADRAAGLDKKAAEEQGLAGDGFRADIDFVAKVSARIAIRGGSRKPPSGGQSGGTPPGSSTPPPTASPPNGGGLSVAKWLQFLTAVLGLVTAIIAACC